MVADVPEGAIKIFEQIHVPGRVTFQEFPEIFFYFLYFRKAFIRDSGSSFVSDTITYYYSYLFFIEYQSNSIKLKQVSRGVGSPLLFKSSPPYCISSLYKKVHVKIYHVSWINQLKEIFESFVREMFYPPFFRESPFLPSLPYLSKEGGVILCHISYSLFYKIEWFKFRWTSGKW